MTDWLLAVHCGAGRYGTSNEAAYLSLLRSALESAHEVITSSCSPTATQIAVHLLHSFEHSSLTNAGLGANLTEQGQVECEASVVCGKTHLVSCCGAVRGVSEPSTLALKLLDQAHGIEAGDTNSTFEFGRQPPLVVVGEHARQLARGFGLKTATEDDEELKTFLVTDKSREHWSKWHRRFQTETEEIKEEDDFERLDTVGAICMDPMGNVAAALSSGGVAYKIPGRLGLAGCPRMGCNASNAVVTKSASRIRKRKRNEQNKMKNAFAMACTGRGEQFIRSNFVETLTRRLTKSTDLERGLRKTFTKTREINSGVGIEGGVLALVAAPSCERNTTEGEKSQQVQLGAAFTTSCMGVGYMQCRAGNESKAHVQLLRQPKARPPTNASEKQELSIHVSLLRLPLSSQSK